MNGIHEVTGSIPVWSTISKSLIQKICESATHTVSRTGLSIQQEYDRSQQWVPPTKSVVRSNVVAHLVLSRGTVWRSRSRPADARPIHRGNAHAGQKGGLRMDP